MLLIVALLLVLSRSSVRRALAARWRRARRRVAPPADDEAVFLAAVRAELRAGASVRHAFVAAAARVPDLPLAPAVRLAQAGLQLGEVGRAAAGALPVNGAHVAAALEMTAATGARAGALFGRLAERAAEVQAVHRERRTLTAQARFSALVVAALPVLPALVVTATGGASTAAASGPLGMLALGAGIVLEIAGLGTVAWMLRRFGT